MNEGEGHPTTEAVVGELNLHAARMLAQLIAENEELTPPVKECMGSLLEVGVPENLEPLAGVLAGQKHAARE